MLTARDLNRSPVSVWQETVQNGRTWTFSAYLADARDKRPGRERGVSDRETAGGTFWRQQHLVRLAQDWTSVVGADRFTLVTVPPPGAAPDLLARRFAQATDLPIVATGAPSGGNESLGLASALVLPWVNELLDERGLAFPAGSSLRKRLLAKTLLAARRDQEPRLGLPVSDWVRAQSADTMAELRRLGARLVGDWDDLLPVAEQATP